MFYNVITKIHLTAIFSVPRHDVKERYVPQIPFKRIRFNIFSKFNIIPVISSIKRQRLPSNKTINIFIETLCNVWTSDETENDSIGKSVLNLSILHPSVAIPLYNMRVHWLLMSRVSKKILYKGIFKKKVLTISVRNTNTKNTF